jgi:PAS domain S-box-containing protein
MGALIRAHDWSQTSLGEIESWPQSLRSVLSICLNSNFPIAIYWGKDLTLIYNDAWSPIPGNKHPWALGKPAKKVWPDIWTDIEPQFEKAFRGEPGGSKDALLPMQRHGYTEECYFDFTFTPVYGEEGKVEGIFNAVIETTFRVTSERRTAFLKNLALQVAAAPNKEQLFEASVEYLKNASFDIPFAMVYRVAEAGPQLLFSTLTTEEAATVTCDWPFQEVAPGKGLFLPDITKYIKPVPKRIWPETPSEGYLLSLAGTAGEPIGILVIGLSARRRFDEEYAIYLEAIGSTIITAYNVIAALEEERKKAEALAEIDKAKTLFFSNISHEFRTPLTLILGSLEELMKKPSLDLVPENRASIEMSHRNAIRLLRLVNNLLDFNRIEAGKSKARFQLTNLGKLTTEVAGSFRSIIENAGLNFAVACDSISEPVYVDRVMWEKILLNLLSNAFKFTLKGEIRVTLEESERRVLLKVKDTGAGIPEKELPKMFERFHRIENTTGRTFEGSGIGLSLISGFVQLHGGTITVESVEGEGSLFIVTIPTGKQHLDPEQVIESPANDDMLLADVFNAETSPLIEQTFLEKEGDHRAKEKGTILVVDDNADMRHYLRSLLYQDYNIQLAVNGVDALDKIAMGLPSLIISDIMMPEMDGIELLRQVKDNPATQHVPVILVSARAGENEKIEGYDLGADDYLVKPFSSKELTARVRSQINIAAKRNKALQDVYHIFREVPFAVALLKGEDLRIEFINQYNLDIWNMTKEEVLGKPLFDVRPDIRQSAQAIHDSVYQTGKRFASGEVPVQLKVNGILQTRYFNVIIDPLFDETGNAFAQLATSFEVTEEVIAKRKIQESEKEIKAGKEQLELTIENVPAAIYLFDSSGKTQYVNKTGLKVLRNVLEEDFDRNDDLTALMKKVGGKVHYLDENDQPVAEDKIPTYVALTTGKEAEKFMKRVNKSTGDVSWFLNRATPLVGEDGKVKLVLSASTDFTVLKQTEEKIRESEKRFRVLADALPQMVWMRDVDGAIEFGSRHWTEYSGIEGVSAAWRAMVHPDEWQPVMRMWEQHANNGDPFRFEVRLKSKTGEFRWHHAVVEPVKDANGKLLKWIGALTDIHTQKTFTESLEKLVAERTVELARSNEDLQQFAHVASHDLKEPVRKVMMFTNRIKTEFANQLPENASRFLTKIEAATIRMYSMIDGVLLYSSLNALEQTKELIDLNELLQTIISDLEVPVSETRAKILFNDLPALEGSPILFYQLFYNLLRNSLKFSRDDVPPEIVIWAKPADPVEVDARQLKQATYVKLVVEDNGIGFDNQHNEKIFASFTRLHSKDKYEGTGLGLALCRKIVERHRGAIYAEGKEGEGATFTILLPY